MKFSTLSLLSFLTIILSACGGEGYHRAKAKQALAQEDPLPKEPKINLIINRDEIESVSDGISEAAEARALPAAVQRNFALYAIPKSSFEAALKYHAKSARNRSILAGLTVQQNGIFSFRPRFVVNGLSARIAIKTAGANPLSVQQIASVSEGLCRYHGFSESRGLTLAPIAEADAAGNWGHITPSSIDDISVSGIGSVDRNNYQLSSEVTEITCLKSTPVANSFSLAIERGKDIRVSGQGIGFAISDYLVELLRSKSIGVSFDDPVINSDGSIGFANPNDAGMRVWLDTNTPQPLFCKLLGFKDYYDDLSMRIGSSVPTLILRGDSSGAIVSRTVENEMIYIQGFSCEFK